jgi:prepilin-type N-terminal cleavage/methylation domain-containing protein
MNANTRETLGAQRGFSLVELLVAMAVTLIVSGAIYGLLTTGGNAFRREPEVADRQQNIRIAMDAIGRDVENAGGGTPLVAQVFTHTDDPAGGPSATGAGAPYLNGGGPPGVMGAAGELVRGAPPTGAGVDTSDDSDILEMVTAEASCPAYRVCLPAGLNGTAATVFTREQIPSGGCLLPPGNPGSQGLVLLTDNRLFTVQPATLKAGGTLCPSATAPINGNIDLGAALPEWPTGAGASLTAAGGFQAFLYSAKVVRYMIAPSLDPSDQAPSLWRSETGRYDATGTAEPVPVAGATNWQVVARGIEDLQVEYMNGGGLWSNNPGVVPPCAGAGVGCQPADYVNVVRRVRVTLSARVTAANLQGEMNPASGTAPRAVRGQLVSAFAPRAAVLGLQAVSSVSQWQ